MKLQEFKNQIEKVYKASFPNSLINVDYNSNLYSSITIRCFLAQNKSECINGYFDNDMFHIMFMIDGEKGELPKNLQNDSDLPSIIKLEADRKHYIIKPTNKHMYCDFQKLSFRKSANSPEKIVKSFEKFIAQLKNSLITDLKNDIIHNNYVELLKSKLSHETIVI